MTAGSTRRRLLATAATAVTGALLLAGCGDQTEAAGGGGGGSARSSDAPLFDRLPKKYQDSGVIKVGSDIAYPPVEFAQGGRTVGIDPDIADAMGKQLGVRFEFGNGTFDGLLTSLRAKRYDVLMSAMSDTKERQQGIDAETGKKVGEGVDFVDYFVAGVSVYVKKGNPENIQGWDDLCGKKIVVQRGTVSHDLAKDQSATCEKDGKDAVAIEAFDNDIEAQTRLRGGGAVAGSSDFPVAAYAVKTSGGGDDFELVGEQVEAAPYGIAVSKDNTQLRDALKAALEAIKDNGEYDKILDRWGVEDGSIEEITINGGS